MKPLTDEATILFIEYLAITDAAAKLMGGSAVAWREGRSEAMLWDAAAKVYGDRSDVLRAQLNGMGYEWGDDREIEWPELIGG